MTIRRLLAASDASAPAEHAVGVARSLATSLQAELEVIAVDTAGQPAPAEGRNPPGTGFSAPVTWARGVPGVEIVRRALEWPADLVVLGRPMSTERNQTRVGITAETVMRRRTGMTLFVPPQVTEFRRVLVALDGTARGLGVLDDASRMVKATGATARAICILPGEGLALRSDGAPSDHRAFRFAAAMGQFPELGGLAGLQIRHGSAVDGILKALDESAADLMVLGVRGGGPKGDMGSGHVGQDLLRAVPVAILTVPI